MRSPYQMQKFNEDDTSGTNIEDYTQLIVDLLSFGQTLCKKTVGAMMPSSGCGILSGLVLRQVSWAAKE